MSNPTPDPDFAAAASAIRALFPKPADVEAQLRTALSHARVAGGDNGALAAAVLEVVGVVHEWNLRPADATIGCQEAAIAVLNAIERGLAG
jgi:hypothetical protein